MGSSTSDPQRSEPSCALELWADEPSWALAQSQGEVPGNYFSFFIADVYLEWRQSVTSNGVLGLFKAQNNGATRIALYLLVCLLICLSVYLFIYNVCSLMWYVSSHCPVMRMLM